MNIQAKKSLGQNFLKDPHILEKIVTHADLEEGDIVVEVGPGQGALTALLLLQVSKVIAVEKDASLPPLLKEKFQREIENNRFEIIEGDILEYKPPFQDYKLIGNIPYYITGEIFRKFLENEVQPQSITFVIQKEVADRIMARDQKESVLSISIKAYGEPQYGGTIKAGSFSPVPKVDSAIITIKNIAKKRFSEYGIDEKLFFNVVKAGFLHKRKLLAKNLNISKETLSTCGIKVNARAEDLTVENWFSLVQCMHAKS